MGVQGGQGDLREAEQCLFNENHTFHLETILFFQLEFQITLIFRRHLIACQP